MGNEWFETVAVARERARKRLPNSVYGAIVAGAEAGVSRDDNLAAFDELGFRPVTAGQITGPEMETTIMGEYASMPVMISPTGVQAVHPEGEIAVARAAAGGEPGEHPPGGRAGRRRRRDGRAPRPGGLREPRRAHGGPRRRGHFDRTRQTYLTGAVGDAARIGRTGCW